MTPRRTYIYIYLQENLQKYLLPSPVVTKLALILGNTTDYM